MEGANLEWTQMLKADLSGAKLRGSKLNSANLVGAHLYHTQLEGARIDEADLTNADLTMAQLMGADLSEARLCGAKLCRANLEDVRLDSAILVDRNSIGPHLADVNWGNANLAVVKWSLIKILGDEHEVRKWKRGRDIDRLYAQESAVRANRQLALVLQSQGLNEEAMRFAYRAQVLQRRIFWFQIFRQKAKLKHRIQALGSWLFSLFLFLLAGYGYKLWQSFLAYLLVIGSFALLYLRLDLNLAWYEALVTNGARFRMSQ